MLHALLHLLVVLLEIAVSAGSLLTILVVPVHRGNEIDKRVHDLSVGVVLEHFQSMLIGGHHNVAANLVGDSRKRHDECD